MDCFRLRMCFLSLRTILNLLSYLWWNNYMTSLCYSFCYECEDIMGIQHQINKDCSLYLHLFIVTPRTKDYGHITLDLYITI